MELLNPVSCITGKCSLYCFQSVKPVCANYKRIFSYILLYLISYCIADKFCLHHVDARPNVYLLHGSQSVTVTKTYFAHTHLGIHFKRAFNTSSVRNPLLHSYICISFLFWNTYAI